MYSVSTIRRHFIRFYCLCSFGLFTAIHPVFSDSASGILRGKNSASAGFGAGLFQPAGYFGREFNSGVLLDLHGRLPATRFIDINIGAQFWLILDTTLQFSNQYLVSKGSANMITVSWTVGPGIVYGWHKFLQPMAILQFGAFYNRLSLPLRNEAHNAFNPAARLKIGFFTEITQAMFTEVSVGVPFYYLGSDNLYGAEISVAANYLLVPQQAVVLPADKAFAEGRNLYGTKNYDEADAKFVQALAHDASHAPSLKFRKMIRAQAIADKARAAKDANDLWSALQLFNTAQADLPELVEESREIRAALAPGINAILQDGIRAYDEKRYADSEHMMEKVLLVAPENEPAKIYLPRARSRRKAMERLQ